MPKKLFLPGALPRLPQPGNSTPIHHLHCAPSPGVRAASLLLRHWVHTSPPDIWISPRAYDPRGGLPLRPAVSSPWACAQGNPNSGPSLAQPSSVGIRRWAMLPPAGGTREVQRALEDWGAAAEGGNPALPAGTASAGSFQESGWACWAAPLLA